LLLVAAALLCALAAAAAAAQAPVTWQPDFAAARNYAEGRRGLIGFAIRTENPALPGQNGYWHWHHGTTMPSASVIKAMILVAYLSRSDVRNRPLTDKDRSMLRPMIEWSSDSATNRTFVYVGFSGLRKLADRVGMRKFKTTDHWGRSQIDAEDQSKFMLHIDGFIGYDSDKQAVRKDHQQYALYLLSHIVSDQRWGIAKVSTPGWKLFFKSGWGAGTGWVDSQVALLKRGGMRVSVAILTHSDPDHEYGKNTLRAIASKLLRGLNEQSVVQ
jgi:hypothetical protein